MFILYIFLSILIASAIGVYAIFLLASQLGFLPGVDVRLFKLKSHTNLAKNNNFLLSNIQTSVNGSASLIMAELHNSSESIVFNMQKNKFPAQINSKAKNFYSSNLKLAA